MDCIFCRIIEGTLPCYKVFENDQTLAILDIHPVNHGHILVLPKVHYEKLNEVPVDLGTQIFKTVMKINKVVALSGCSGTNVLQNNGKAAGQEIGHVHFHVIPRYLNDNFRLKFRSVPVTENMLIFSQNYYIKALAPGLEKTD